MSYLESHVALLLGDESTAAVWYKAVAATCRLVRNACAGQPAAQDALLAAGVLDILPMQLESLLVGATTEQEGKAAQVGACLDPLLPFFDVHAAS